MENETKDAMDRMLGKRQQFIRKYIDDYYPLAIGEAVVALLESGEPLTLPGLQTQLQAASNNARDSQKQALAQAALDHLQSHAD